MTSLVTQPKIPKDLVCPITHELMKDPVITNGGQTYERDAIERWMTQSNKDPLTRDEITCIIPNVSIRKMCQEYRENTLNGVEIASKEIKEIEEKLKKKITELKKQQDNLKEQQDKVKEIEKNIFEMNNNEPILPGDDGDNWGDWCRMVEEQERKFNNSINKVRNWTVQEVLTWLRSMKLVKYLSAFERHNVNGKKLCEIFYKFKCHEDVDYLENTLGVKVGLHRVRLFRAFIQLGDQSITLPTRNGSVTITHSSSTIVEQFQNDYGIVSRTTTTTSTHTPDAYGNINCTNCVGCTNCIGCKDCTNCNDCNGCIGCTNCNDCNGCTGCNRCKNCTGCADCERCHSCTGCQNCYECTDSTGCADCEGCAKCKDCRNFWNGINCENCKGGKDCTDCKNCYKCNSCKWCADCENCFMCFRCVAIINGDNLRNCSY